MITRTRRSAARACKRPRPGTPESAAPAFRMPARQRGRPCGRAAQRLACSAARGASSEPDARACRRTRTRAALCAAGASSTGSKSKCRRPCGRRRPHAGLQSLPGATRRRTERRPLPARCETGGGARGRSAWGAAAAPAAPASCGRASSLSKAAQCGPVLEMATREPLGRLYRVLSQQRGTGVAPRKCLPLIARGALSRREPVCPSLPLPSALCRALLSGRALLPICAVTARPRLRLSTLRSAQWAEGEGDPRAWCRRGLEVDPVLFFRFAYACVCMHACVSL